MSLPANPQKSPSRDVALAALAEALEKVGQVDERLARVDRQVSGLEQSAARQPPAQQTATAVLRPRSSVGALVLWSLIGPLLFAGIGATAFAWPSPQGHVVRLTIARWVQEGLSTSSVWRERLEHLARPASSDLVVTGAAPPQPSSEGLTTPPQVGPIAAPISPELTRRLETIVQELANMQQAIEQLRASQAPLAHDNAGLAARLKETQEQMVRLTGELADDLKQARSEMMRGSSGIAAQLKANQEQVAGLSQQLKATQEQIASLGATELQPRPSNGTSRRKSELTPASRQVRVRPSSPN